MALSWKAPSGVLSSSLAFRLYLGGGLAADAKTMPVSYPDQMVKGSRS